MKTKRAMERQPQKAPRGSKLDDLIDKELAQMLSDGLALS